MVSAVNTPDPLRDYNGSLENLKAMKDMVRKEQLAKGEKPADVDHKAIAENEKKFAQITNDVAQMDFQKWLKLTIAGFQNQDPMNPKDPGAVTAELANIGMAVGFSKIPAEIAELKTLMNKGLSLSATNRLGQTVEAQNDTFKLSSDKAVQLGFDTPVSAPKAKVLIYNQEGQPIREINLEDVNRGRNNLEWDGKDSKGAQMQPGHYRFKVRVLDADDNPLKDPDSGKAPVIKTYMTGTLESSFTNDKGISTAVVDGSEVPFDALTRFYGKQNTLKEAVAKTPDVPHPLPKPPLTEHETFIAAQKEKLAQDMQGLRQEIEAIQNSPIDPKDLPPGLADL